MRSRKLAVFRPVVLRDAGLRFLFRRVAPS
jgi:hypothetical protein